MIVATAPAVERRERGPYTLRPIKKGRGGDEVPIEDEPPLYELSTMPVLDFLAKIVEQERDGQPRPRYRLEDVSPAMKQVIATCRDCGGPGITNEKALEASGGKLAHKDPLICANVRRNTKKNDHEDLPRPRPPGRREGQAQDPALRLPHHARLAVGRPLGRPLRQDGGRPCGGRRDRCHLRRHPARCDRAARRSEEPARPPGWPARVLGREGQPLRAGSRPRRLLVGVDGRLWPLLEGLDLWGDGSREPVAGFKDGQIAALVMPRILSEADRDPAPPRPLPDRARAACQAATDALVTHYNPAKALEAFDVTGAAESLVERNALKIVRTPGLAAELRTIIGECQAPAWIVDKARYAEMMRKRSSRAGDFHAKVCGHLDRAESAELKRASAARKGG